MAFPLFNNDDETEIKDIISKSAGISEALEHIELKFKTELADIKLLSKKKNDCKKLIKEYLKDHTVPMLPISHKRCIFKKNKSARMSIPAKIQEKLEEFVLKTPRAEKYILEFLAFAKLPYDDISFKEQELDDESCVLIGYTTLGEMWTKIEEDAGEE